MLVSLYFISLALCKGISARSGALTDDALLVWQPGSYRCPTPRPGPDV